MNIQEEVKKIEETVQSPELKAVAFKNLLRLEDASKTKISYLDSDYLINGTDSANSTKEIVDKINEIIERFN